jgi:hypothetical protein
MVIEQVAAMISARHRNDVRSGLRAQRALRRLGWSMAAIAA